MTSLRARTAKVATGCLDNRMLGGQSHFQESLSHELRFLSKGTIRLLPLEQIVQRPSYASGVLVIPVIGQEAKGLRRAPRPTSIQSLPIEKLAYLHRLEARWLPTETILMGTPIHSSSFFT